MPAYKDKKTGTWYVKFYYMDYNGSRRQKMKRGFLLKRDALTWEREFLHKASGSSEMSFASLAELYLEDLKANRKHSSFVTANSTLKNRILPTFGDVPISAISPGMIRRWQNDLMNTNLSASYINRIDGVFRAVIAFAVRYCGLKESPIENTKRAGEAKSEEMKFYTAEQYERFIATFKPGSRHRLIFNMLFYTGCRIGELLAITAGDIDLEHETMRISLGLPPEVAAGGIPVASFALMNLMPMKAITIPFIVAALFFWGALTGLATFLCLFCLGTGGMTALQNLSIVYAMPIYVFTFIAVVPLVEMCNGKVDAFFETLTEEEKALLNAGKPIGK